MTMPDGTPRTPEQNKQVTAFKMQLAGYYLLLAGIVGVVVVILVLAFG